MTWTYVIGYGIVSGIVVVLLLLILAAIRRSWTEKVIVRVTADD